MPALPPTRRRYRSRFVVVYAVLAAVLGGAVAGLVLLVARPGHHATPAWSSWKPKSGDTQTVADQVAAHVAGEYRFADGKALVAVDAHAPTVLTLPVGAIELRGQVGVAGNVIVQHANRAWMYQLCGGGIACSIARGKPSRERGMLVRREALELALYTFKFAPAVDSVIALLPPATPVTTTTPRYVLYLRKNDLAPQLKLPLRTTLPPAPVAKAGAPSPAGAGRIDDLALPRLFRYQPQQLQDGTIVLVLDPPALNG